MKSTLVSFLAQMFSFEVWDSETSRIDTMSTSYITYDQLAVYLEQ